MLAEMLYLFSVSRIVILEMSRDCVVGLNTACLVPIHKIVYSAWKEK
jgi:hypothetical protein